MSDARKRLFETLGSGFCLGAAFVLTTDLMTSREPDRSPWIPAGLIVGQVIVWGYKIWQIRRATP